VRIPLDKGVGGAAASSRRTQRIEDVNAGAGHSACDSASRSELVVGPFQGLPACVRIPLDKGVCGAAASSRRTQRIEDVNAFAGHIACDSASRSELVVPLVGADGALLGVFDLDSPRPARFDADDQAGLEALAAAFLQASA
jgi:GAF domain-containing protein